MLTMFIFMFTSMCIFMFLFMMFILMFLFLFLFLFRAVAAYSSYPKSRRLWLTSGEEVEFDAFHLTLPLNEEALELTSLQPGDDSPNVPRPF